MATLQDVITETRIVAVTCGSCGIVFGLGAEFQKMRLNDHRSFYCPNGCHVNWSDRTEADQIRADLDRARARTRHLEDQRDAAERSARAYRGHAARLRNQVAAGECPCCGKTFKRLATHMASKHPEYAETEPAAGGAS